MHLTRPVGRLLAASVTPLLTVPLAALAAPAVASAPTAAAPTSAERPHVVQLGDSYSSGNGTGTYTEKACYRSPTNYGSQVARRLGATYTNASCGGGVVKDILEPRALGGATWRTKTYWISARSSNRAAEWLRRARSDRLCGTPAQPDYYYRYTLTSPAAVGQMYTATARCQLMTKPQIKAVNRQTDMVFLTMGGNDIGFTDIVVQCLTLRSASGCRGRMETANAKVPAMKDELKAALRQVHRASGGQAEIYLLSYPYLINRSSYRIPEIAPRYDAGAALKTLQIRGDRVARRAMTELREESGQDDFHFVDGVKRDWGYHQRSLDPRVVADNRDAWLVPILTPGREIGEFVHPNQQGWDAMARTLHRHVTP